MAIFQPFMPGLSTDQDKLIKDLFNAYIDNTQQLQWLLTHLGDDNIKSLDASKIKNLVAENIVTNTLVTQTLYATYGRIADLTVNELSTAWEKVTNYKTSNTADVNYIHIYDQNIDFITASTTGLTTEQLTDSNNKPLYWLDATEETMAYEITDYPVTVYVYTELTKMQIKFEYDAEVAQYVPKIVMGVGIGSELNPDYGKGFVYKDTVGLLFKYIKSNGEDSFIRIGENGTEGVDNCEHVSNPGIVSVVSASEVVAVTRDFTFTCRSKALIHVSCEVEIAGGAANLSAKTYIDGVALPYHPSQYCAGANKYVLTYHDFKYGITPGTKTIEVKLQTGDNTGSIAIGQALMTVQVFNDALPPILDVTSFNAELISSTQISLAWVNPIA